MMDKRQLRKHIRELKRQYSDEELVAMSRPIVSRLLAHSAVVEAKTIVAYSSLPDEVDTKELLTALVRDGKTVLLPHVIDGERMELRRYEGRKSMAMGCYGILEPTGEAFAAYDEIDVAVIPGMAFDAVGNRLGRGKGYYDRFITKLSNALKIGVCFDFQKLDNIPTDANDIKMDVII